MLTAADVPQMESNFSVHTVNAWAGIGEEVGLSWATWEPHMQRGL